MQNITTPLISISAYLIESAKIIIAYHNVLSCQKIVHFADGQKVFYILSLQHRLGLFWDGFL